ncbi:hypothetical protein [Streptomyces thermoalcalitolerans]|uniref:Membrane-bound hydrophilic protein n=1 Tax=Streptomyces thermoalcalitolerans TaxID=65605 RepID=A0ABP3Z4I0_9ACTN
MPTDEVAHGAEADESRARSGHRHAAPRKPLFNRFHLPAGKAMVMAAMPTAVLMGMGVTSTFAVADNNPSAPSAKNLTIDEYKDCIAALEDSEDQGKDTNDKDDRNDDRNKDEASAAPTPSASASAGDSTGDGRDGGAEPAPSAGSANQANGAGRADGAEKTGRSPSDPSSSADAGSGGRAAPQPSATAPESEPGGRDAGGTAAPAPSESAGRSGGLLGAIGDTLENVLTGGKPASTAEESPAPGATPSPSATPSADETKRAAASAGGNKPGGAGNTTAGNTTARDTGEKTTGTAGGAEGAEDTGKTEDGADGAAGEATALPSPSASPTTDPENCPVATDAEGGVDNTVPLADDPWYLDASSLLLMGADYQGIVKVRTANGTVKRVLKYVVSQGTDIGDLHQTVRDERAGKTYHVQAAKGSMSRIRGGKTVMYTEKISGKLFGLLPAEFSPDNPPPLNLPLIYFTDVHVVQAAQFGGNLHVPGMHVYTTG